MCPSVCVFTWTAVYSIFYTYLFLVRRNVLKNGINICQGDQKNITICCYTLLRASTGGCGMRLFFGDTLTPPLSVFSCALSKTKHCTQPPLFCLSCHSHSFYAPYLLFFYTLPLLPPSHVCSLPPSLFSSRPFSLRQTASCPFLCLLCW